MKAYDISLFGASWWPYASFERLQIATYLSLWVLHQSVVKYMFIDISITTRSCLRGTTVIFDSRATRSELTSPEETDSPEFSSLVSDVKQAESFRAETIAFINNSLGTAEGALPANGPLNDIITCFQPVGQAISQSYTDGKQGSSLYGETSLTRKNGVAQLQRFHNELMFFIEMTGLEQQFQMRDHLPSVEEYQRQRIGSGAVGACLAITEYAIDGDYS